MHFYMTTLLVSLRIDCKTEELLSLASCTVKSLQYLTLWLRRCLVNTGSFMAMFTLTAFKITQTFTWNWIIHLVTTFLKLHSVNDLNHLKNLPNRSLIWSVWSCWGSSGSPCGCRNSRRYLLVFHNSWCHHHVHFVQAHKSTPFLRKFQSRGGHQGCEPTRGPKFGLWLAYFRST